MTKPAPIVERNHWKSNPKDRTQDIRLGMIIRENDWRIALPTLRDKEMYKGCLCVPKNAAVTRQGEQLHSVPRDSSSGPSRRMFVYQVYTFQEVLQHQLVNQLKMNNCFPTTLLRGRGVKRLYAGGWLFPRGIIDKMLQGNRRLDVDSEA